jgi:hypothetical protein
MQRMPLSAKRSNQSRGFVLGDAAHADLRVLGVDAAEHHQRFGVIVDGLPPVLMLVEQCQEIDAEHVGHDGLRASRGIAAERSDIAADAVEEAVHLALRVVEAPCRGPAVGAAEDRLVAVVAACGDLAAAMSSASSQGSSTKSSLPRPSR